MSCFVPIITQKLARLQQQQQITQTPAPAKGLLCSKAAIFLFRSAPKSSMYLTGSNSPTMHVQMNCLTHKPPWKSFPVTNWLGKAGWILDGRSAHCCCTGNSHQVPDTENLKLIGEKKKKEASKTFLGKHTEALKAGVCTQRGGIKAPLLCAPWSRAGLLTQSHWDVKGIFSLCFIRWS